MEDLPVSMDLPPKRFNAALAVGMDDKLYIYGGTYEKPGKGEVTLNDLHVIDLGKLDGVRTLWDVKTLEESEDEDEDEDDEDEEMEAEAEEVGETPEETAVEEMQVDMPTPVAEVGETTEEATSSFNSSYPQPLPFESLKAYYDRTSKDWLALARDRSKAGRREAFLKAEGYWWETREEIREMEERMEESGIKEVVIAQSDRKEKRR
jgi:hypothetical protein